MNDKYEKRLASVIDKHDNRVTELNQEISSLKAENQQRARKEQDIVKEMASIREQAQQQDQQWKKRESELLKEIERLGKKNPK